MSMLKKLLLTVTALLLSSPVVAQDWTAGQQSIAYTSGHQLGDGSNSRGGEAPYFASEPADIPTDSTTKSTWTLTCSSIMSCGGLPIDSVGEILPPRSTFNASISGTTLHVNSIASGPGPALGMHLTDSGIASLTYVVGGSAPNWTVNNSQTVASMNMTDGGFEAKARFDCNDAFDEPSDPILKPGQSGTSMHDHHFFGNKAAQGSMASVNYAWLRANGDASCFGRPMNRTLYWEPTLYKNLNGVAVSMKAYQIPTYYVTGNITTDPLITSRWERGKAMIFGFDFNDPLNQRMQNGITAAGSVSGGAIALSGQPNGSNGFVGWTCPNPDTPSYTAYAPNQVQGAYQPYLNDGMGHGTLRCLPSGTVGGIANGIEVLGELDSPQCWDGKNPRSPSGRDHMAQLLKFNDGNFYCPDGWYRQIAFIARPYFVFKDMNEVANVYLSSDRMPTMPMAAFNAHFSGNTMTVDSLTSGLIVLGHPITGTGIPANTYIVSGSGSTWTISTSLSLSSRAIKALYFGGQTMHADLIPAWDYGTGDNLGFMASFFRDCDGISMHLKNSDGVTYTDLVGNPHECNFGRAGIGFQTWTWQASPDASPALQIDPNLVGNNRYFPIKNGTTLNSTKLNQKH